MRILGENFYNMLDADEIVVFSESEVETVTLQPIEIELVDVDTLESAGISTISLVIVTLIDGRFLSTRPDVDTRKAGKIAEIVAGCCQRFWTSKLN